ncbi:MAG: hypothetical protein JXB48_16820 [Candidatus Latescibacteria bacterium]|nr:hypothetical protein [Candidatus Latescibacterota bacterium]
MLKKTFFPELLLCVFCLTGLVTAEEESANVAGTWSITIKFIAGTGNHTAVIEQKGEKLSGTYKGEIIEGTLNGTVKGNTVDFSGFLKHEATGVSFHYTGTVDGDTMSGTVEMGEYWTATWTAKRAKKS